MERLFLPPKYLLHGEEVAAIEANGGGKVQLRWRIEERGSCVFLDKPDPAVKDGVIFVGPANLGDTSKRHSLDHALAQLPKIP